MSTSHPEDQRTLSRKDVGIAILIILFAVIWSVSITEGKPSYGFDGVSALHVAQNIADGDGITARRLSTETDKLSPTPYVTKPFLYPAVTAGLIMLGVPYEYAAWSISIGAWSITAALLYILARQAIPLLPALVVPVLFVTHVTSLRWGITIHEQALFVAISFSTLWQLTIISASTGSRDWPQWGLVGVLSGLAMITSYQGLPLIVTSTLFLLVTSWANKAPTKLLAYFVGIAIVGTLPFLRFLNLMSLGIEPEFVHTENTNYYGMLAGIVSAFQNDLFGKQIAWLYDGSWSDTIIIALTFAALAAMIIFVGLSQRAWLPLSIFFMIYIAIYVMRAGAVGTPIFEPRYLTPIYGILFLHVVYVIYHTSIRLRNHRQIVLSAAYVSLLGIIIVQAARYESLLDRHGAMCDIADTVKWVNTNLPLHSGIITTQCGYQLHASRNDIYLKLIPPAGGNFSSPYWTETNFLAACGNIQTLWVVAIDKIDSNQDYVDPFISSPGYGQFVNKLIKGTGGKYLSLVARTKEGFVYQLKCRNEASSIKVLHLTTSTSTNYQTLWRNPT